MAWPYPSATIRDKAGHYMLCLLFLLKCLLSVQFFVTSALLAIKPRILPFRLLSFLYIPGAGPSLSFLAFTFSQLRSAKSLAIRFHSLLCIIASRSLPSPCFGFRYCS